MNTSQNTAQAVEFLRSWPTPYPVLSASFIDPKTHRKGLFETRSFPPGEDGTINWALVANWIDARQGCANLYFSVNSVIAVRKNEKGVEQKAERTDLKEMVALQVDVDPRLDETPEDARSRILAAFDAYEPRPSVVIASGGGAQAFWLLQEPIPIDGDLARAEDLKLYNLQLERDFGGDACHNTDRVMRIPSTWNVPDKTKIDKGRKLALAELIRFDDIKYPIDKFAKAAPVVKPGEAAGTGKQAHVVSAAIGSGPIERFDSFDDPRLARVNAVTKVIILHGFDRSKYGDTEIPADGLPSAERGKRSENLLRVVCDLVRAEVSNEDIYAIITDPEFSISETVLNKGREMRRYALRQIERANDMAVDPDLAAMNKDYAVVNMRGKTRVLSWVPSDLYPDSLEPIFSGFDDFRNLLMKERHRWTNEKGEEEQAPMGTWWLNQEGRAQYKHGIIFAPAADVPPGKLNLWNGWAVDPKAGSCGLYLKHIKDNICSGNDVHYDYLIKWMARAVQRPNEIGEVAVVLRGKEGTGKGVFAKNFGALFGLHYLQVIQSSHLVGKFNAHLLRILLLYADEAFFAGDKKNEAVLKGLVTEGLLMVEHKGIDTYAVRNLIHLILSSNNDWIVPAGGDARRWFVLDVADTHMQDSAYFEAIRREMEKNGGREALLHYLMSIDISDFDIRSAPKTDALNEQKSHTRKGMDGVIEYLCREGRMPCANGDAGLPARETITSGRSSSPPRGFYHWIDVNFPDLNRASLQTLSSALDKWDVAGRHSNNKAIRVFPALKDLRAEFEKRCGGPPPGGWQRPQGEWEADDALPF
jgi:hypothetical protein